MSYPYFTTSMVDQRSHEDTIFVTSMDKSHISA